MPKKIVIRRSLKKLLEILNVLILKHKANIDNVSTSGFKVRSYTKMMDIMTKYPHTHIKNVEGIKEHFIKNGVAKPVKIVLITEEYIKTGKNTEAIAAAEHPELKSIMNLTKIYAIGPANAKRLYAQNNITTITELKNALKKTPDIINNKQKIGLKYYTELQKRIPREEINKYFAIINEICSEISPDIMMSINGSYRRGMSTSGDIDILITSKKNTDDTSKLRGKLIKELKKRKIIIETLAGGKKKFMGIARLKTDGYTIARHVDIIDTSKEQYPYAQLYFTGSGGFNSMMRTHALTMGYSLNEYTLSHKTTKKPIESDLIKSKLGKETIEEERDIFDFLEMTYVTPEDRNNITLSKVLQLQDHE